MNSTGSGLRDNLSTSRELLAYIWRSRYWWLTPIIVVLILMSALVVFLESSVIAPFIYALF